MPFIFRTSISSQSKPHSHVRGGEGRGGGRGRRGGRGRGMK